MNAPSSQPRDLFAQQAEREALAAAPLAERMRPRTVAEVVGQDHLVGEGKILRRAIDADRVFSMLLWGPPGSGKTTLAQVIARATRAEFRTLSAVLAGVADIRKTVEEARGIRKLRPGAKFILFIDEIHRFNKAQQDALLPHVENGLLTLIGATTENPSFEVNAALLSRLRVFTLRQLDEEDLRLLVHRALSNGEHGLAGEGVTLEPDAETALVRGSFGDARRVLTVLEAAAGMAESGHVTLEAIEQALQHRTLLYDKCGDEHYNVVSAFIKSLRGSDPDAAVYWMARMLEAGEEPRFVLRRMVVFASEDIGNADPQALVVATATLQAFEFMGMPEGVLPLTQCATYLATAPKSNGAIAAYKAAVKDVKEHGPLPVPMNLRNAPTTLMKRMGYGDGYRYPHNFEGHYVAEKYLPDELAGRRYYEPTGEGYEATIKARMDLWQAELARSGSGGGAPSEKVDDEGFEQQ